VLREGSGLVGSGSSPPRHTGTSSLRGLSGDLSLGSTLFLGGSGIVPVACLDQMYAQATVALLELTEKAKQWALACGGCFPLHGRNNNGKTEFVKYRDVAADSELQGSIKFSSLKRHRRAIEKLIRSYNNDPSHLVDIARLAIVFDTLQDLCSCLRVIVGDHEDTGTSTHQPSPTFRTLSLPQMVSSSVLCVSCVTPSSTQAQAHRHPFPPTSLSSPSCSDVNINLNVHTGTTLATGAHTHVCEVQLMLRSFADVKTLEGHKRYVRYRDFRAQ